MAARKANGWAAYSFHAPHKIIGACDRRLCRTKLSIIGNLHSSKGPLRRNAAAPAKNLQNRMMCDEPAKPTAPLSISGKD